jgi:hypothetical protein
VKHDKQHRGSGDEHPQIRQTQMEERSPKTLEKSRNMALRYHVQILLPKHLRNPHQRIRTEMGGQNHSIHNQGNNHPKIQQIQDEIQEGVLWNGEGIQEIFDCIHEKNKGVNLMGGSLPSDNPGRECPEYMRSNFYGL